MIRRLLAVSAAAALLGSCGVLDKSADDADLAACSDQSGKPEAVEAACGRRLAATVGDKDAQAEAYLWRGIARGRMNKADAAIADMDSSLQLAPDNYDTLMNRGILFAQGNRFPLALQDFNAAIALDPKRVYGYGNRGVIYQKTNEHARAVADFSHAIELDPGQALAWGGRCWSLAALNQDLEQARSDCNKAIEMHPEDWNSYNSRGLAEFRMGQFAEAIASYDIALQHEPEVASSWLMRGLAKRASGDARGEEEIAKGMAMDPAVADRYRGYGLSID